MGDGARRYTEREFALILRKAAELQDRPGDVTATRERGLTLHEISSIAREVGLDPALVSRAAAELDTARPGHLAWALGGSAHHRLEASVGRPLPPDAYPQAIAAIRAATGQLGEARDALGSLEWKASDGTTQLWVTLIPGPDATCVVVGADRSSGQAVTWLLSTLGSLIAVGITGAIVEPSTVAGGLGLAAGILGAGLLTARTVWSAATRRFQAHMAGILERISSDLRSGNGLEPR
jgi:hypothetical protein